MAKDTTFTFRPKVENLQAWTALRKICKARKIPISELWNSILLPLVAELAKQPKNPQAVYEMNLGLIRIEEER